MFAAKEKQQTSTLFCVGDVVQLKTGGPMMVISEVTGQTQVGQFYMCDWFTKKEKYKRQNIPGIMLVRQ